MGRVADSLGFALDKCLKSVDNGGNWEGDPVKSTVNTRKIGTWKEPRFPKAEPENLRVELPPNQSKMKEKKKEKEKGKRRYTTPKPYKSNQITTIASSTPLANLSLKSVVLHDWWLSLAHPKGLAISGFECTGRKSERVLCSAAIAIRHNATTLETKDGITISITGFINTSRTLENGFSPQVCSHFLFGFPYDWEEFASPCSNEESASRGQASITDRLGVNRSFSSNPVSLTPDSLDNLPVTRIRDLLMFSAGEPQNSMLKSTIFDHVVEKLCSQASQNATISVDSNMGSKHPDVCPYSADAEASNCHKKVKVIQNHIDDTNFSNSRTKRTVEFKNGQSLMGLSPPSPTTGVTTRSMTKLKYLTEKREGLLSRSSRDNRKSNRQAG